MSPELTIIIPCLNEEGAINETLCSLSSVLGSEFSYEIIAVDDGSSDSTGAKLSELCASNDRLRVITHERNLGYGAALKSGIRRARGTLVAIIDADGTYPITRFPDLIALCRDVDMVVGARVGSGASQSKRRTIAKYLLARWVSWIARTKVPDINSGMRIFKRSIVERYLGILPDGFSFTITITLAMLTNYHSVHFEPIDYAPRIGKSKIQPIQDTLRFITIILRTGMYFAPLRALMPLVLALFCLSAISFGYDVFVLRNLTDKTVLLFLSAFNTAMLALLADMIDKRTAR